MNVRTMAVAVAVAVASLLSGCVGGGGGQTLEEAKVSTQRLGTYMAPVVADADARVQAATTESETRAALAEVFGPAVSREPQEDGSVLYGGAFRFDRTSELTPATTIDGRPTLLTWSLTGGAAFFYQPTVLDVATGAVYQGLMEETNEVEFFGPFFPPADARTIGTFTVEELWELEGVLRASISGAAE